MSNLVTLIIHPVTLITLSSYPRCPSLLSIFTFIFCIVTGTVKYGCTSAVFVQGSYRAQEKNDKMTLTASLVYTSQQSYISTSRVTRWSKIWYVMSYKNRKLSSIVNSLRNLSSETDKRGGALKFITDKGTLIFLIIVPNCFLVTRSAHKRSAKN